jgi:prepilin-type N-terminal cleavage/methylation domain-containing protein
MKKNNKGFTLAEMLIVVAIIAVLIAIAIPTFMGQMTRAQRAADAANLRAAYSTAASAWLLQDNDGNTSVVINETARTVAVSGVAWTGTLDSDDDEALALPATPDGTWPDTNNDVTATFTFNENGTVDLTVS